MNSFRYHEEQRKSQERRVNRIAGKLMRGSLDRQQTADRHVQRVARLNRFQQANRGHIVLRDDLGTIQRTALFYWKPMLSVAVEAFIGFELVKQLLGRAWNVKFVGPDAQWAIALALTLTIVLAFAIMALSMKLMAWAHRTESTWRKVALHMNAFILLIFIPLLAALTYGGNLLGIEDATGFFATSSSLFVGCSVLLLLLNIWILTEAEDHAQIETSRIARAQLRKMRRSAWWSGRLHERLQRAHLKGMDELIAAANPLRETYEAMRDAGQSPGFCWVTAERAELVNEVVYHREILPVERMDRSARQVSPAVRMFNANMAVIPTPGLFDPAEAFEENPPRNGAQRPQQQTDAVPATEDQGTAGQPVEDGPAFRTAKPEEEVYL
ncbi:MAG: hypothetical protein IPP83_13500 [Flavobacteriales bacterium]|nr:hypothetical protein [Flavobacteriales bacterium]